MGKKSVYMVIYAWKAALFHSDITLHTPRWILAEKFRRLSTLTQNDEYLSKGERAINYLYNVKYERPTDMQPMLYKATVASGYLLNVVRV